MCLCMSQVPCRDCRALQHISMCLGAGAISAASHWEPIFCNDIAMYHTNISSAGLEIGKE